jgi:hypothetical protein
MRKDALLKWCITSAAVVLATTGAAKVWSALGDVRLLTEIDPIIGIQFRQLLLAVGLAEMVVAPVCLIGKRPRLALGLVAWMATSFLVYRIGLWWMGWKKPCNCLGNTSQRQAGSDFALLGFVPTGALSYVNGFEVQLFERDVSKPQSKLK